MTLKEGWLDRQFEMVKKDIQAWPEWMRREAKFSPKGIAKSDSEDGDDKHGRTQPPRKAVAHIED